MIRRNIILTKYTPINDTTVQEQIFDNIFQELDEQTQTGRLTLEQLIEVVSLFLDHNKPKNHQQPNKEKRRKFKGESEDDSELQDTELQRHSQDEEEVIEEDEYYDEEPEPNQSGIRN